MSKSMFCATLIVGGVALALPAKAVVDLPSGTLDRAIACTVYGGFAPPGDPPSVEAKRVISEIVDSAMARGELTREHVRAQMYDVTKLAMYDEPRSELIANWNECRASFAR